MAISSYIRAWILLIPLIPSILVTIYVLYLFLKNQTYRKALNNHVIFLLLSVGLVEELTAVIWNIYLFFNNIALSTTPAFCLAWVYIDSVTFISIYLLMTWATFERHLLIFHTGCFSTRRKRLLFHYFPLSVCIIYPVIFYFSMFFILPCNYPYYYGRRQCAHYSCILLISSLALFDSIAHNILPIFAIVIFSLALFVRVLYQKYRIRQRINWRNYKKMAYQLFPISLLYTFIQLPPMILYAAYSGGVSRTIGNDYYNDALIFTYWTILFTPFASAITMSEFQGKYRNIILFLRGRRTVHPVQTKTLTRGKIDRAGVLVTTKL